MAGGVSRHLLTNCCVAGSHKERFTPDGKGKGLAGRDRPKSDLYETFREDVHKPSVAKRKSSSASSHKPAQYEAAPVRCTPAQRLSPFTNRWPREDF